jgi:predicted PurR-regulated permease PerM
VRRQVHPNQLTANTAQLDDSIFRRHAVEAALVLAGFCSIVIGSIDNVLRPRLVGHDTKMSDLLILFSTLGGIAAFGAIGFIIGPIIAALLITIWEIFGKAYRDDLDVEPTPTIRLPR